MVDVQAPWRTIELGQFGGSRHVMMRALRRTIVHETAKQLLGGPSLTLQTRPVEVGLVCVSVRQLTGLNATVFDTIAQAGQARGWQLCPAEVGPALFLQYPRQPHGEELWIAMEPLPGLWEQRWLFYVGCPDQQSQLGAGTAGQWLGSRKFVFQLPS